MNKKILIDASYSNDLCVAVIKDKQLEDFEYSTTDKKYIKGNIYLAKITRIEPSLQAAFVDYGEERHGFIPFAEIHSDYYNIPVKDRAPEVNEVIEHNTEEAVVDGEVENSGDCALSEHEVEKLKLHNASTYKIQEVLKKNQILLIQAVKDERGSKGASFTTYISLAGRYCVIVPNSGSQSGISKKINNSEERKRLSSIVSQLEVKNVGLIVRTNGQNHSKEDIAGDFDYLIKLWNKIREKTLSSNAPSFIHAEDDLLKRVIREMSDKDCSEIVVHGDDAYRDFIETAKLMSVQDVKITKYHDKVPLFDKYGVSSQIMDLYNPVAVMSSGSYIVINHTEALIAIDVNSGKATSERNIEETAFKTNMEATKEIARQVKLRNLSGLIVIDFIDMVDTRSKKAVEKSLKDLFIQDKARVQIGHISSFGLLEMSRQRLKPNFLESHTVLCNSCRGKGVTRSPEINVTTIFKTLDSEIVAGSKVKSVNVYTSHDNVLYLLNHKRFEINAMEKKYGVKIYVFDDHGMSADSFAVEIEHFEAAKKTSDSSKSNHNKKGKNNHKSDEHKKSEQVDDQENKSLIQNIWDKIVN